MSRSQQFVVLGAGFDSRPYRLPSLRNTTVFEVDLPCTQAVKRRSLERALRELPKHVRFVASDFTQHDLQSNMAAAGYRESARTFFPVGGCHQLPHGRRRRCDPALVFARRAGQHPPVQSTRTVTS